MSIDYEKIRAKFNKLDNSQLETLYTWHIMGDVKLEIMLESLCQQLKGDFDLNCEDGRDPDCHWVDVCYWILHQQQYQEYNHGCTTGRICGKADTELYDPKSIKNGVEENLRASLISAIDNLLVLILWRREDQKHKEI